jgi:hypothetical protein
LLEEESLWTSKGSHLYTHLKAAAFAAVGGIEGWC